MNTSTKTTELGVDIITIPDARFLPPAALDIPRYGETPEAAAARCARAWGCPVTVWRVAREGGGVPMIFIARESEGE